MAKLVCPKCQRRFIRAFSEEEGDIELVQAPGRLYSVRARKVTVLGVSSFRNVATRGAGYVRHACDEEPLTLGTAPLVKDRKEPGTLGDPAQPPPTKTIGDPA